MFNYISIRGQCPQHKHTSNMLYDCVVNYYI